MSRFLPSQLTTFIVGLVCATGCLRAQETEISTGALERTLKEFKDSQFPTAKTIEGEGGQSISLRAISAPQGKFRTLFDPDMGANDTYIVELNLTKLESSKQLEEIAQTLNETLPPVALRLRSDESLDVVLKKMGLSNNAPVREQIIDQLRRSQSDGNGILKGPRARTVYLPAIPLQKINRESRTTLVWRAKHAELEVDSLFGSLESGAAKLRISYLNRQEVEALQKNPAVARVMNILGGGFPAEKPETKEEPIVNVSGPGVVDYGWMQSVANTAAARESYLVILDSGWPQEKERDKAITEFRRICAEVRKEAGLGSLPVWSQFSAVPALWATPVRPHSSQIQEGLKPLRTLDPHGLVKVLYLPFWQTQGSEGLLAEIALLGAALENRLTLSQLNSMGDVDREVTKLLPEILANVKLTALRFDSAKPDLLITDRIIVRGLVTVLDHYAKSRRARYAVSCSWVVPAGQLPISLPSQDNGVLVTAAGNIPTRDLMDFDLAKRVASSADTVTVLNITDGKLYSSSSSTRNLSAINRKLVGFDGRVAGVKEPATSFATPRVGWFIAFGEALRKGDYEDVQWLDKMQQWLHAARVPRGAPDQFLLNPETYIEQARKEPQ